MTAGPTSAPPGGSIDIGGLLTIDVASELRKLSQAQLQGPWQIPAEIVRRALRFGAAVSDMMQLGRATEANERASDIAYGQVSAILDANTCPVCEAADGFQSEDLGEVDALAPNPDCEGGANCRCLPIFILRGVEEAA